MPPERRKNAPSRPDAPLQRASSQSSGANRRGDAPSRPDTLVQRVSSQSSGGHRRRPPTPLRARREAELVAICDLFRAYRREWTLNGGPPRGGSTTGGQTTTAPSVTESTRSSHPPHTSFSVSDNGTDSGRGQRVLVTGINGRLQTSTERPSRLLTAVARARKHLMREFAACEDCSRSKTKVSGYSTVRALG
jgi:hypothetical protein